MIRALRFLAASCCLRGCISLLPKPPPRAAHFCAGSAGRRAVAGRAGRRGDRDVASRPASGRSWAVDLIWRTGDEIAYVAQTQWSNRAADALQQILAETIIRQGRFRASTRSGEARSDYEIRWEVLDFEVREDDMTAHFSRRRASGRAGPAGHRRRRSSIRQRR